MNRKSPQTPAAVSFFRHFLINFLRPYGIAYPPPTETEVLNRVLPLNCEWFGRPATAISEFASTIEANLDLLSKAKTVIVKTSKFDRLKESLHGFMDSLKKFNTKNMERDLPTPADVKTFLQTMLSNDDEVDGMFAEMFELGGAMYLLGSHFLIIKKMLQNPEWFAETTVGVTKPVRDFKSNATVKGLKEYLTQTTCSNVDRDRTSGAKSVKRNLAAMLDSDDDDDDVHRPSTSTDKAKSTLTMDDSDDEVLLPSTKSPKKKKIVAHDINETDIIGRAKGKGKGKGKKRKNE